MVALATGLFSAVGSAVSSVFGGGGAAAGTAGAAAAGTAATGAATGGSFLSTLLQGGATLLSASAAVSAGNQDADMLNAQAIDAEAQQPLENLQGIQRRASIRRAMAEAQGDLNVAYAASGGDLSFGTPNEARREAWREADYATAADNATQETRVNRLNLRASTFRRQARRARSRGWVEAGGLGLGYLGDVVGRG